MMNWIKVNRIQLTTITIGIVSFLCFIPSISNDFVFDDIPTIINNKDIRPEKGYLTRIFFNDYWGTPITKEESHKSYRPLTILTFRWNYMLHGLQVTGYHLINSILHSIVSALFFRLCLCFTQQFWESFISSIYFAIHPIHVDAVASIVGRAELLSATFSLSALLYYCRYHEHHHYKHYHHNHDKINNNSDKSILIVSVLTLVGTFCKEQASTILIVCIYHEALIRYHLRSKILSFSQSCTKSIRNYFNQTKVINGKQFKSSSSSKIIQVPSSSKCAFYKKTFYLSIGFIVIAVLRLAIMNNKLPTFNRLDNPARILPTPYRQLNYAYIWAYNCWLLLYPFDLSCDWSSSSIQLITSLIDVRNISTFIFLFTLIMLLLRSDTITWLGLGFMIITFLPASNIFFPLGFVIAERVLYLPSMGFSIVITRGFILLYSSIPCKKWVKTTFYLVTFVCFTSLTLKTIHRCYEWSNEMSLFSSGLSVNPNNVKLLNNVGRLHENIGNYAQALAYYEKAVTIQPDDVRGYLNLGKALTKIGRLSEAETFYRKALDLIPRPDEISPSSSTLTTAASTVAAIKADQRSKHLTKNVAIDESENILHSISSSSSYSSSSLFSSSSPTLTPPPSLSTSQQVSEKGIEQLNVVSSNLITSTGRLTFPGYERLVNQGTNTDHDNSYMRHFNHNDNNHYTDDKDDDASTFPSLSPPPSPPPQSSSSSSTKTTSDNNYSTKITLNHLQGLLDYASLISRDESRLDEANRMFSIIASMKPDYSVTYSTWIQSMLHGSADYNDKNNDDDNDNTLDINNDNVNGDANGNDETILSQVTLNNKQTDPNILYNMAILFNNNGKIESALRLFDQALSIDPYHEETLLTSARIIKDNELIGDYLTIAMERLETLVSMGKADETVYFDLGMLSIRSGAMANARRYFAKAIEMKPNFTEALFNMALLLYKEERPQDALPFLKFLLQTEETHGKALLLMIAINSSNNDSNDQLDSSKAQKSSSSSLPTSSSPSATHSPSSSASPSSLESKEFFGAETESITYFT